MPQILQRSVLDWPQGVSVYQPDKCFNGYTLFCPVSSPTIYLIDMDGEVVHMWFVGDGSTSKTTTHAKYVGDGRILCGANWLTELTGPEMLYGNTVPKGLKRIHMAARD